MNKENSIGVQNELSTEINDSSKSYSSRYKQLKAMKSNPRYKYNQVLPFKLQKAAIVIQKFWRMRMVFRNKAYQQLLEQLDNSLNVLAYQKKCLNKVARIYESDCEKIENFYEKKCTLEIRQLQNEASLAIRQMAIVGFRLQKKLISQQQVIQLQDQLSQWKQKITQLSTQKQQLKDLLCGQLHLQQQQYLRRIKQQNLNLLRVSKQKGQAQKQMRQKLIQTCKQQISL